MATICLLTTFSIPIVIKEKILTRFMYRISLKRGLHHWEEAHGFWILGNWGLPLEKENRVSTNYSWINREASWEGNVKSWRRKERQKVFFFWEKNSKYLLCPCYALLPIILHVFNISTSLWIFVWAYLITNSHCRYIVYDKWLFFYVLFSFLIFYLNSFWGCNNDYFSSSLIIVYSFWGAFCILWDLWYDMFMS